MQPLPMNELAKAQLEAAGFKVKFEVMDWNTLLATFWGGWEKNPNVDAINVSLSVLDPVSGFLKHFTTSNRGPVGLNWGWYQNKEIDALADKVQATFDEAERKKILQQMHEMVVADGGRVFIVHDLNPARALAQAQRLRSGSELVPGHDADRRVRDDELSLAPRPDLPLRWVRRGAAVSGKAPIASRVRSMNDADEVETAARCRGCSPPRWRSRAWRRRPPAPSPSCASP